MSSPQNLIFDGADPVPTNVEWRGYRKLTGAGLKKFSEINELAAARL